MNDASGQPSQLSCVRYTGVKAASASVGVLAVCKAQEAASSASNRLRTSASESVSRAAELATGAVNTAVNGAVYSAGAVAGTAEGR